MSKKTKAYATRGPWDDEPDELDFIDEKTGYACRVLRNTHAGNLCGYVQVPSGHPLHGVAYNAPLPDALAPLKDVVMEGEIGKRGAIDVFCLGLGGDFHTGVLFNVHGGITFSGDLREREGHWFGFDCAHCDDLSPRHAHHLGEGAYRDIEYVKAECASLAKQLKQVAG